MCSRKKLISVVKVPPHTPRSLRCVVAQVSIFFSFSLSLSLLLLLLLLLLANYFEYVRARTTSAWPRRTVEDAEYSGLLSRLPRGEARRDCIPYVTTRRRLAMRFTYILTALPAVSLALERPRGTPLLVFTARKLQIYRALMPT